MVDFPFWADILGTSYTGPVRDSEGIDYAILGAQVSKGKYEAYEAAARYSFVSPPSISSDMEVMPNIINDTTDQIKTQLQTTSTSGGLPVLPLAALVVLFMVLK